MIEVYLLGIFVAYVKLAELATVNSASRSMRWPRSMLVMATIDAFIDYDDLWEEVERKGLAAAPPPREGAPLRALRGVRPRRRCGRGSRCPRCGARLHRRKPDSLARYLGADAGRGDPLHPGERLPDHDRDLVRRGRARHDPVGGEASASKSGMWPLALLVFFASITVPVLKIVGLTLLLVTTQLGRALAAARPHAALPRHRRRSGAGR